MFNGEKWSYARLCHRHYPLWNILATLLKCTTKNVIHTWFDDSSFFFKLSSSQSKDKNNSSPKQGKATSSEVLQCDDDDDGWDM